MTNKIIIGTEVDIKDAEKALKSLKSSGGKAFGGLEASANEAKENVSKSFLGMNKAVAGFAAAAGAALAAVGIAKSINAVVEAASKQQDAVNSLNNSLKLTGEFSAQASQDIQDYASELQKNSVFGDEVILQQFALAKAFGASNEQAKLITTAAAELAAATGKSLDEATRQVSKTLGGFAGELGEVNPEIKALTAEQLKNGDAAKILIAQYGGSAQSQIGTFSGAITQLQNIFGDVLEVIGDVIIQNPIVIKSINALSVVFTKVGEVVKENQESLTGLVTGFLEFGLTAIPVTLKGLGFVTSGLKFVTVIAVNLSKIILSLVEVFLGFKPVQIIINSLKDQFLILATAATQAIKGIVSVANLLPGLRGEYEDTIKTLDGFSDSLIEGIDTSLDFDELSKSVKSINESLDPKGTADFFDGVSNGITKATNFAEGLNEKILESTDSIKKIDKESPTGKPLKKVVKEMEKITDTAKSVADQNKKIQKSILLIGKTEKEKSAIVLSESLKEIDRKKQILELDKEKNKQLIEQLDIQKKLLNEQATAKASAPASSTGGGQASDENNLIKDSTVSAISQGLGEGAGAIAESVAGFINPASQIVEGVKAAVGAVQSLIDFIPDLLNAVAGIFDSLADLPTIILEAVQNLFDAIVKFAGTFLQNLVKSIGGLIKAAFRFLLRDLPKAILETVKELPKIISETLKELPSIIVELANNIGPIVTELVTALILATPDIMFALVDSLILNGGIFRISFALAKALAIDLPIAIGKGIINSIRQGGETLFRNLGGSFSRGIKLPKLSVSSADFFKRLNNIMNNNFLTRLKKIVDSINPAGGGGFFSNGGNVGGVAGSVGGAISKGAKSLGFATGGTVPAGFPNDNFPARLTSGEEVVNRDTSTMLREFLAREMGSSGAPSQSVSQNITVELKVGEAELSRVLVNLSERGYRVA